MSTVIKISNVTVRGNGKLLNNFTPPANATIHVENLTVDDSNGNERKFNCEGCPYVLYGKGCNYQCITPNR